MHNAFPVDRFEPHRAWLTALARRWLNDPADAQDAVQDTWLRAQAGAPASLDNDRAWLVTVLRRLCIDRLRRHRIVAPAFAGAPTSIDGSDASVVAGFVDGIAAAGPAAPSAEHAASVSLEAQAVLERLAAALPAGDLAALLLHAVFDYEHAEIARMAGQTEAATRQRVHRALRRARTRLADGDAASPPRRATPVDIGTQASTKVRAMTDTEAEADARAAMASLCWRALHLRDATGLIARISRTPARLQAAQVPTTAKAPAAACTRPPRSTSQWVHVDGAFALAWVLDGVVLCTVPLRPASTADDALAEA